MLDQRVPSDAIRIIKGLNFVAIFLSDVTDARQTAKS